jgi:hypothetical protein
LNWEFCPQYQTLVLIGDSLREFSHDNEIKQIARLISRTVKESGQDLIISFVTFQGEILYHDQQWTDTDLLIIQNLVRYKCDSIKIGESFKLLDSTNLLFIKIQELLMLVCMTSTELDSLLRLIQEHFSEYNSLLESYLNKHPLVQKKPTTATEK